MFRQLLIFFLVLMSGVSVVRADAHEVAATIFGSIAPQSTVPGKQWQLRLRVPERDGVAGEVSASHLPAGAQLLTESSQWVVLDWTPAATQSGKYSMTVSARFEGKDPISFFQVVDVNVVGDSRPIRMRPSIVVPKRIDQIDAMAEEATRNATDAKAETESAAIGVAEPGSSMVSPETDSSVEETAEAKPSTDEIQSEDVQIEKAQTEEALDEQLQQGRARVQELENKKLEKQALRQRLRAERLKKQQSRLLEEDQQRARNRQARAKFIQERRAKESILKAQQTEEQEQLPVAQEQALELPTAQEQVAEEQLAKDPVVQEQTQIERAAPATQEEQALSAQGQEKQHSETPLPGQAASKEVASGEQASDEQTSVLPAEQGSESLDTDDPMLDERGDEGENSDEQATLDLESNADAESVRQSIALLRSAGGNTALAPQKDSSRKSVSVTWPAPVAALAMRRPAIERMATQIVSVGRTVSFELRPTLKDGRVAAVHVDRLPRNASFERNPDGSRTFFWPTNHLDQGEHRFRFTANHPDDPTLLSYTEAVIIVGDPSQSETEPRMPAPVVGSDFAPLKD